MEEETAQQQQNSMMHDALEEEKKVHHLQPWQFKKGQSGNPSGRKSGESLKEYSKRFLACMTDEEKDAFMEGLSKDKIWAMAEGNPENKTDLTSKGEQIMATDELIVIANKLNDISKNNSGASISSDGVDTNAVDAEIQS